MLYEIAKTIYISGRRSRGRLKRRRRGNLKKTRRHTDWSEYMAHDQKYWMTQIMTDPPQGDGQERWERRERWDGNQIIVMIRRHGFLCRSGTERAWPVPASWHIHGRGYVPQTLMNLYNFDKYHSINLIEVQLAMISDWNSSYWLVKPPSSQPIVENAIMCHTICVSSC